MGDYNKFLAAEILSEGKLVTYRLLSRALEVHVHTAKRMLFDFHESQNGQKPSSVHATYLIYGEKREDPLNGDEDVEMSSSSPGADVESLSEPARAKTLMLVQEDMLKDALSLYKTVLSAQIYSLGPHPTKDLQLLSEVSHGLSELSTSARSPGAAKSYGGILNPGVKRRDRRGFNPALENDSNTTKTQPPPQKPAPAKPSVGAQLKNKSSESPSSSQGTTPPSAAKAGTSGTKARSGGIMQSFAKAAASKKDSKPKLAPPPAQSSEKKTSSTAMASDDDDGEEDSPSDFLPKPKAPGDSAAARKARDDRVAELKRMMEEDDEDEAEEAPSSPDEVPQETPQDAEEAEMKLEADAQSQGQGDSQGGEVVSGSGNGRKRGKRKVIKKRQVQDDEGYFVTVRETAWESFSEDEAPLPKKATPPPAPSSGGAAKAKKPAPKGQGSIMSFFGKKT